MTAFSRILLTTAAFAALPSSQLLAADYDPPMIIDDAPEYVPVEIGSGWYLRGDVTYNLNRSVYDEGLLGEASDNTRFGAGIGFGYHFNDFFRAEVNGAFVSRDHLDVTDGGDSVEAENTLWSAMVNGYVDLGTFVGVTPFVGAGVGFLRSKNEVNVDAPGLGLAFDYSDRQYAFAYSLGAGVNYQVTNNLSVDVGYQYLNSPSLEYADLESGTIEEGVDYHQVKVGLRYDLW